MNLNNFSTDNLYFYQVLNLITVVVSVLDGIAKNHDIEFVIVILLGVSCYLSCLVVYTFVFRLDNVDCLQHHCLLHRMVCYYPVGTMEVAVA